MDKIRSYVKELLLSISKRFFEYFKIMDTEITNYLKGLEIFMVIQLFEYSILFFIVGHQLIVKVFMLIIEVSII